jgi:pilus assembly protein TadC
MIVSASVAGALYLALRGPHGVVVSPTLVMLGFNPFVGVAVGAAILGALRVRHLTSMRTQRSALRAEEILAADLVASGVEAGVSFDEAASVAADFLSTPAATEIGRMTQIAHHPTVGDGDGSVIDEMFRLARRSSATGAPLAQGLRSLSESESAKDAADRLERLERLPVKLLFPLAFLILPGFLLVAVAPALVSGIAKLSL